MASITSWIRIEPRTRDPDLAPGVEARIHDPLWALARQWQLGELDGDDAGSAITVRTRMELARIDAIRPAGVPDWTPLDAARTPLEALAHAGDREPAPAAAPPIAERARTGRHLLRLLADAGIPVATFLARYPLAVDAAEHARLDAADRRLVEVMSGRVPDGDAAVRELAPLLAAGDLPASFGLGNGTGAASAACRAWLAWRDSVLTTAAAPTWRGDQLAHAFELRAAGLELVAARHGGGPLRWSDLDVRAGDPDVTGAPIVATKVPARVRYRGMPARRYWELEDGAVHWPSLDAGPGDVARLLFTEFAVTFADDWLLVPIDVPTGSVVRIGSVVVTDTFGVRTLVRPAPELDGPPAPWRFCEATSADGVTGPLLVVLSGAPGALVGPALDVADVVRDEVSNTYWGVERTRHGADARPRDVVLAPPAPPVATPGYRLGPEVGDAFHPYIDRIDDGRPELARATIPGRPSPVTHSILPALIAGHAAPARPVRIQRRAVVMRSPDGAYHAVLARTVELAPAAPPTPALIFDRVE